MEETINEIRFHLSQEKDQDRKLLLLDALECLLRWQMLVTEANEEKQCDTY